ncbi:MAG: copper resistance protein CopC [Rhodopila sp.]
MTPPYPTTARMDSNGAPGYTPRALAAEEQTAVPNRLIPAALFAALLLPDVATAHAILEDSTPAINATIKPGELDLRLRYNSRIDRARSRLTLIRPDHGRDTVPIALDGPPDVIATHLDLAPGRYVLRWQVLAVDGHITRGDLPFTVTAP